MSKLSEIQKSEIKEMVADKLGFESEQVLDDSKLKDDLGCDSLDELELIVELEKMYNISILDDEAENATVISDYYELVEQHIQ
jgi:acyl carrier protein